MSQLQNQFSQAPVQGMLDLKAGSQGLIVEGIVDSSSDGGLVAGQPVKMVDSGALGTPPKFVECAADTDDVFGFIVYDIKAATYAVGDRVTVASGFGAVMYMTASAAAARNAKAKIVISGVKVVTESASGMCIGRFFDKPTADGDLVRVIINIGESLTS